MNSKAIVALLTVVACCWAIPLESTTALPPPAGSNGTTTLKPANSSAPLMSDALPNADNTTTNSSSALDPKIIQALSGNVTEQQLLQRIIECGLLDDPEYKKNETKVVRSAEVLSACGNLTLSKPTNESMPANSTTTPAPKTDSKEGAEKKPEGTKKPTRREATTPKVEGNSTLPALNKTVEHQHANGTDCDEHGHPLVKGDLKEGNSTAKNETMKPEHDKSSPKNETLKPEQDKSSSKNETLKPDHDKSAPKNETLKPNHDKSAAKNETLKPEVENSNTTTTTTTEKPAARRRRNAYGSSQVRVAVRHQPNYAAAAPARSSNYEAVRAPTRARKVKAIVREESYSAPAVREESYSAPAVREESYSAPAVREESYSAPAIRAESYSAPVVVREESYSAPAIRAESYSAPVVVREESYAPAIRAESYSAPVVVREESYAPAVREETYEPAVVIRESSSGYEAAAPPVRAQSYAQPSRTRTVVRSGGY